MDYVVIGAARHWRVPATQHHRPPRVEPCAEILGVFFLWALSLSLEHLPRVPSSFSVLAPRDSSEGECWRDNSPQSFN